MKIILCYKKYGHSPGSCHTGLGNSCRNTSNVLRQHGFDSDVWPIAGGDELRIKILQHTGSRITHIVIAAPFIPSDWMCRLAQEFPLTHFAVVSHSNVGFLQAESAAIRLMRQYSELSVTEHNFHAAANNSRLVDAFHISYGRKILHLPNLYDVESTPRRQGATSHGHVLKIGSFGALRVQKNFTSAAWAAIAIARKLRKDLEFYVNIGRTDNNGSVVENAIIASTENLPGVKLVPVKWESPLTFRRTIASMNILIQPSYTETFSMVTADAISEGVPVVVTPAVEWAPRYWKADADDVSDITKVGLGLLQDPFAAEDGYRALLEYNHQSYQLWLKFISKR